MEAQEEAMEVQEEAMEAAVMEAKAEEAEEATNTTTKTIIMVNQPTHAVLLDQNQHQLQKSHLTAMQTMHMGDHHRDRCPHGTIIDNQIRDQADKLLLCFSRRTPKPLD